MTSSRLAALSLAGVLIVGTAAARLVTPSYAAGAAVAHTIRSDRPSIVLVHGAFADGSGWADVIRLLQKKGYMVTAAQNPLTSYSDDVKTTKRLIDAQPGNVVVVGHSYGGAVITSAAAGSPKVKALVYVAAFAPDVGEPIGAYLEKYPSALGPALRPDAARFVYIDPASYPSVFAADIPASEAAMQAAAQKPVSESVFGAMPTEAAWNTIPSWYVVAQEDHAINPDLERFYAKRMGATTREIKASHIVFISHPQEVVDVIETAAAAAAK